MLPTDARPGNASDEPIVVLAQETNTVEQANPESLLDPQFNAILGRITDSMTADEVFAETGRALQLLADAFSHLDPIPQPLVDGYLLRLQEHLRGVNQSPDPLPIYHEALRTLWSSSPSDTPTQQPPRRCAVEYFAVTGLDPDDPPDPDEWGIYQVGRGQPSQVANTCLFLDENIAEVDDLERQVVFLGRLIHRGETHPFRIAANDYASDQKLLVGLYNAIGSGFRLNTPLSAFRNAVAAISQPVSRATTTRFGWDEGGESFLVPSGILSANGFRPVSQEATLRVEFAHEERARFLDLLPLSPEQLVRVKRHIVEDLLEVHDTRVVRVLLAVVGLAVLHRFAGQQGKFALWLTGLTGCGKTFLARLFQSFFGPLPPSMGLPSWTSTVNYLERQGYYFANAIYVIDDYKPNCARPYDVIRLLQAYGDGTSRGRLHANATTATSRPIRGFLVVTGEDVVEHTPSALARSVVVRVPQQPKDLERGLRCQQMSEHYSGVTADFIRWLLAQGHTHTFAERVRQHRGSYHADINGQQNDSRIAGNFALLAAAGELILAYLGDVWPDAPTVASEFVQQDLVELRNQMLHEVREEQESTVFLRILSDLLLQSTLR